MKITPRFLSKQNVLFCAVLFLFAMNEVKAGSLFEVYFTKWTSGLSYTKAESHSLFTVMPYSDLLYVGIDSSKYLIHKQADGKPFAVEKLSLRNTTSSTRNLSNQYAGMIVWSLENNYSDLFWSYVNSSSVTIKSTFLSFSKEKNDSVFKDLTSGKLAFSTLDLENESIINLYDSVKKDTVATFRIQAKFIDLIGGDQNNYNLYLADIFENGKVISLDLKLTKAELIEPFRNGLVRLSDEKLLNEVTKDEPIAKEIMGYWLNANFSNESFEANSEVELAIAGRDTLRIVKQENEAEFCKRIKNNLSVYGEIAAIGLLSVKEISKSQKQMRFVLLLKQEQLAYEHVLRIDHIVNEGNEQWSLGNTKILLMAVNPPGKTND